MPRAERFPAERLRERLGGSLQEEVLDEWLETAAGELEQRGGLSSEEVAKAMGESERRAHGVYMTPGSVARGLAVGVDPAAGDRVVDLSAGSGALLEAAARQAPELELFGVERHPALAVVAAARLVAISGAASEVRIWCGDGLAEDADWAALAGTADAVVANPPYVREKGRKERFREIRREHDHLEEFFGPRLDLAYLFVHRSLDYAAPGARLALLTSAYWLSATGAEQLRRDLAERARPRAFVRSPGTRLFEGAPGHHSLISVFERRGDRDDGRSSVAARTLADVPEDWGELVRGLVEPDADDSGEERIVPPDSAFRAGGWSPFSSRDLHEWGERQRRLGTLLGELVSDRQGFVSGADRVTARRLGAMEDPPASLEPGDPGFLWEARECTESMRRLRGTVLRPVLRGSRLEANTIRLEPPTSEFALYLDGELAEGQEWVVEHLAALRPALEDRREVRRGTMPWYRLHWPRERAEQTGPKLVMARRGARPRCALDLSASAVSSDCTYLIAPPEAERPVCYLATVMVALNRPEIVRYLRHFGKRKGEMLEFYSEPLRNLPLPLREEEGRLAWIDDLLADGERELLARRVDGLLQGLECGDVDAGGKIRL